MIGGSSAFAPNWSWVGSAASPCGEGLGAKLSQAITRPANMIKSAPFAAFAVHGPRAADRLSQVLGELVVAQLQTTIADLEAPQ